MNRTRQVNSFIGATVIAAAAAAGYTGTVSHSLHPFYALAVLALAAATSRMKVKLPGIDGNMSVNLPFLLTAAVSLSSAEAVTIAAASTVVQCWPKKNATFRPQQLIFNVSMMALAISLTSLVFHSLSAHSSNWSSTSLAISLATATLFLSQTLPVATVIGLSEGRRVPAIWWNVALLSFPYFVVSAGVTSMMQSVNHLMGWQVAVAVFPVMYVIHRSYRLYFANSEPQPAALARTARAGA